MRIHGVNSGHRFAGCVELAIASGMDPAEIGARAAEPVGISGKQTGVAHVMELMPPPCGHSSMPVVSRRCGSVT
jgi:hypothetical protein